MQELVCVRISKKERDVIDYLHFQSVYKERKKERKKERFRNKSRCLEVMVVNEILDAYQAYRCDDACRWSRQSKLKS